jgi:hypothetical protein
MGEEEEGKQRERDKRRETREEREENNTRTYRVFICCREVNRSKAASEERRFKKDLSMNFKIRSSIRKSCKVQHKGTKETGESENERRAPSERRTKNENKKRETERRRRYIPNQQRGSEFSSNLRQIWCQTAVCHDSPKWCEYLPLRQ